MILSMAYALQKDISALEKILQYMRDSMSSKVLTQTLKTDELASELSQELNS